MDSGTFTIFCPSTKTEYKRGPEAESRSSRQEKELEHAYIRSHVAKILHAKRRHAAKVSNAIVSERSGGRPTFGERAYREDLNIRPLPLLMAPSTPYQTIREQISLQFYQSRCLKLLGKDNRRTSFEFWHNVVPQLAWQHQGLRHALISLSLGTQALSCNSLENPFTTDTYHSSLEHQNTAMKILAGPITAPFILPVAAMVFSTADLAFGDWDNACQHSLAALEIINAMSSDCLAAELKPMVTFVQSMSQIHHDFFKAMGRKKSFARSGWSQAALNSEFLAPKSLRLAPTENFDSHYRSLISPGSSNAKEHPEEPKQRRFLNTLVELMVARFKLLQIMERLQSSQRTRECTEDFSEQEETSSLLQLACTMNRNTEWIYRRWTSAPYLKQYLTTQLTRRFLDLQSWFDYRIRQGRDPNVSSKSISPSPFTLTIDELASYVGTSEAAEAPNPADTISKYDIDATEDLACRLGITGHLLLVMTAGTNPHLKKDILELTETTTAETSLDFPFSKKTAKLLRSTTIS